MTKIAILSDSHDHLHHLRPVLQDVCEQGVKTLLHCGDLCAPFVVAELANGFDGPIHIVEGNNDGDGRLIRHVAQGHSQITLHGVYAELEVAGAKLAMIHYPEPARRIAQSGAFRLVAYGHDHKAYQEKAEWGWLVNPGEIMGRFGEVSWGLYDTESDQYSRRIVVSAG
jgi:putative phosphoesterase